MTNPMGNSMPCPKEATPMRPMGRQASAWRCPTCRGVFVDTGAMRRRRAGRPPIVGQIAMSVLLSLLVTRLVRRLRGRNHRLGQG